jgi:hypothetical protein
MGLTVRAGGDPAFAFRQFGFEGSLRHFEKSSLGGEKGGHWKETGEDIAIFDLSGFKDICVCHVFLF